MKRIITIMIILVMCFAIAFPVSAAVTIVDSIGRISRIDKLKFDLASGNVAAYSLPSGYKYVFFVGRPNGVVAAYVSNDSTITTGSSIYIITYNANGTIQSVLGPYTFGRFELDSGNSSNPIWFVHSSGSRSYGYSGFLGSHSTATILNYSSLCNIALSYGIDIDWFLVLPVDTSALQALLSQAKAMQNTGYTQSSWQALLSQITAAENLLASTDYTQADIDNAKNALQSAIDGLVLLPDVTELEKLLVEADSIEDIGYTVPTWTRFDNARYAGHALIARQSYTQTEVTDTATELRVSMNSLTLAAVPEPDPPPKPPPSSLGYDLQSGNVSGYLKPVSGIFYNYVLSAQPVAIGIFGIVLGILIIPRVLGVIIPNIRR